MSLRDDDDDDLSLRSERYDSDLEWLLDDLERSVLAAGFVELVEATGSGDGPLLQLVGFGSSSEDAEEGASANDYKFSCYTKA